MGILNLEKLEEEYAEFYNNWYIVIDENNYVIDAWSDGPHPEKEIDNAILINNKGNYQFAIDGEENPIMFDWDGNPIYKWENGQFVKVG